MDHLNILIRFCLLQKDKGGVFGVCLKKKDRKLVIWAIFRGDVSGNIVFLSVVSFLDKLVEMIIEVHNLGFGCLG